MAGRGIVAISFGDLVKLLILTFVLLIALHFLGRIAHVLLLFSLVIILAMMLTAPVSWLERRRVPRWCGSLIVIVALLGIATLLGFLFIPPLVEQTNVLGKRIPEYYNTLQLWLADVTQNRPSLQRLITVDDQMLGDMFARAEQMIRQAGQFVITLIGGVAALFIVLLMTVFTLVQPRPMLQGLFALLPKQQRMPTARALRTTARQVRVWVWSSTVIGLIVAAIAWGGLTLLNVQPALLLASLAFFGEFFPYIGPVAAAVPAVALAFAVGPITPLWILILYLAIHQLEASLLTPLIVSRRMRFHPLSVGFSLIALGTAYGILGAFLAVPALAAVKAFYTELIFKQRGVDERETRECANLVLESQKLTGGDAGEPKSNSENG